MRRVRSTRSATAPISSASSTELATGFWTDTCLPASSAAITWSWCMCVGVSTSTASTESSASRSARSVYDDSAPHSLVACRPTSSSVSQTATMSQRGSSRYPRTFMAAMLPAPSTPSRTLSIRPSLDRRRRLRVGPECAPVPGGGDLIVVIPQHRAQDGLGVLAHRGCLGRGRKLLPDEVQWREKLVRSHGRRGQQREAIGELRIFEQRLGRVDRRDRRVDPAAELQPLRSRLGAEDVVQLALELAVAPGVVRILG